MNETRVMRWKFERNFLNSQWYLARSILSEKSFLEPLKVYSIKVATWLPVKLFEVKKQTNSLSRNKNHMVEILAFNCIKRSQIGQKMTMINFNDDLVIFDNFWINFIVFGAEFSIVQTKVDFNLARQFVKWL